MVNVDTDIIDWLARELIGQIPGKASGWPMCTRDAHFRPTLLWTANELGENHRGIARGLPCSVKVLPDVNLDHALRRLFWPREVVTVAYMGWASLKNGELLRTAEETGLTFFLQVKEP
jgi:hypothetical protein